MRRRARAHCWVAAVSVLLLLRLKDSAFAAPRATAALSDLSVGQQLRGVVSYVADKLAMVDVGAEKEGLVPISKMLGVPPNGSCFDCLKEGDQVNVWVSEISNPSDLRNSKLVLSTDKAKVSVAALPGPVANVSQFRSQLGKVWFNGTVSRLRAYGMFVVIAAPEGDGFIEGLVHKSEATYNATIGSELRVRALRIDTQKNYLYLSMRTSSSKGPEARLAALQDLTDRRLQGIVTRAGRFGAFVEIPHPDGGKMVGLVPYGEKEEMRRQQPKQLDDLLIGQELIGFVLRVRPLALVDVGLKVRGLLPEAKMTFGKREADEEAAHVNLGDMVQVWVSEVRQNSSKRERPSLILAMDENRIYSRNNTGPVAALEDFLDLDDQQWHTGLLTCKMEDGWYVNVQSPRGEGSRRGFVYLPECKGDGEVGSQVQVRILRVNEGTGRMDLSMRTSPPLRGGKARLALYQDLMDQWLEGRVKSFGPRFVSVEVEHQVAGKLVGILPKVQMQPKRVLAVDEKIEVRVWDVTDQSLFLSMHEKVKEMPKEFRALMEDELGSALNVELLEEGQEVEVRIEEAGKDGLFLALCT